MVEIARFELTQLRFYALGTNQLSYISLTHQLKVLGLISFDKLSTVAGLGNAPRKLAYETNWKLFLPAFYLFKYIIAFSNNFKSSFKRPKARLQLLHNKPLTLFVL